MDGWIVMIFFLVENISKSRGWISLSALIRLRLNVSTCSVLTAASLCVCVSRPAVKGGRAEPDSLSERRSSRQKPEGDEGGDPGHAGRDEETTAGGEEEHRWWGVGVRTHMNNTHTHMQYTVSLTHKHKGCGSLPLAPTRSKNRFWQTVHPLSKTQLAHTLFLWLLFLFTPGQDHPFVYYIVFVWIKSQFYRVFVL